MMSEIIDSWVMPGIQGGPLMHVIAAKAVAFGEALTDGFKTYTGQVIRNAQALAAAMVARGYYVISGGTDNHLMLIDLRSKGLTGKAAENALDHSGITCNKNAVPFDDKSPLVTSGIRLGTAAMTSRGLVEADMETIANFIDRILMNIDNTGLQASVESEVREFCSAFPLYPDLTNGVGVRPELPGAPVAASKTN
jgi:glycine hydroxymethyltransferase